MRLQLTPASPRLQIRVSYSGSFSVAPSATATIQNGIASWTLRQGCVARFQWPGYKYDNPGVDTVTLSLRQSEDPGQAGPELVYVQETHWNVPCASNHPIGTERTVKILHRQ